MKSIPRLDRLPRRLLRRDGHPRLLPVYSISPAAFQCLPKVLVGKPRTDEKVGLTATGSLSPELPTSTDGENKAEVL